MVYTRFIVYLLLGNIEQQNELQSYGTIKRTYPLVEMLT